MLKNRTANQSVKIRKKHKKISQNRTKSHPIRKKFNFNNLIFQQIELLYFFNTPSS